jgi:hypothetical protein
LSDEPSVRLAARALRRLSIPAVGAINTLNEWLRLNGSQILAAILVFGVQPGLELPPLILRLFSS